jgi:DNA-binding NtrC family response regulator
VHLPRVVLVGGDPGRRSLVSAALSGRGFQVERADATSEAAPDTIVLVLADADDAEAAGEHVARWCHDRARPVAGADPPELAGGDRLLGGSACMQSLRAYLARVAPTGTNVLITGETGTGKELVAELIHANSGRRGPFVAINCAAIPDGLLESELFGFERGAFTGATAPYEGKLRLAGGGTVFLDEVGDMSPFAQAKLLRTIENREVYRLGGRRPVPLDVRVLAATNEDLERLVEQGRFRKDLFYRLNVARVHLPPLRERADDVPALLEHCLGELHRQGRARASGFSTDALECLSRYPWPGNVRELRNVVEVLALGVRQGPVQLADLPPAVRDAPPGDVAAEDGTDEERNRLLSALRTTRWNKSRAAQQLQWSRMTVYRKMAKYAITEAGRPAREPGGEPG